MFFDCIFDLKCMIIVHEPVCIESRLHVVEGFPLRYITGSLFDLRRLIFYLVNNNFPIFHNLPYRKYL